MARLGAAIIAYDNPGTELAGQEIGQDAFPTVSETQIYNDVGAQRKNSSIRNGTILSGLPNAVN